MREVGILRQEFDQWCQEHHALESEKPILWQLFLRGEAVASELHSANVNLLHTKQSMQKRIEHLEELLWGKP